MKKGKIILLALMFMSFLSFIPPSSLAGSWNGWIYQNPYPTSNTLLAVKFVTPEKGWMAGQYGTILYTEDGGETWQYQESGTEQDLKSISFVNEKVGWAVGNGGVIIYTEDGGKKWQKQGNFTVSLHKVFPINGKECWVGGAGGMLLYTNDGGKTWRKQDIGTWYDIAGIFFKDINRGWVLSRGKVYMTRDGGKNWEVSQLPIITPQRRSPDISFSFRGAPEEHGWDADIFFLTDRLGWAVLGLEQIYKTEDGGKTWQINDLGFLSYGVGRLFFINEKNGCAIGTSILCTEDGGKTWDERLGIKPGDRDVIEGFLVALWGIQFTNQSTGWAVGAKGQIFKTEDGGKNWKVVSRPFSSGVYFIDSKTGWNIVRDYKLNRDSLIRTDDGGNTWTVQKEFGAPVDIRFFFINHTTGWAVGQEIKEDRYKGHMIDNYFIFHTHDGGKTWVTQFKEPGKGKWGSSDAFQDVCFINPDIGWAVGDNGLILHTKDGGKHWKRQNSGTKSNLWRVQFINAKRGWGIGNKVTEESGISIILYTDDGGEHWHVQWKKKTDWMWLDELHFIDERNGWVAGDIAEYSGDWIFLHTIDGGEIWLEKEFKEIFIDKIFFLNKNRGVILTEKGLMLVTNDGGKTWSKERQPIRRYPWHISEIFKEKGK
jgi:photosystem II stability/assembly factor-like uncharacterized protein